ncbi:MAG: polysaccharide biosynthesis/export family protein [Cyanobacteria bacterium P01_F01_bin.53]
MNSGLSDFDSSVMAHTPDNRVSAHPGVPAAVSPSRRFAWHSLARTVCLSGLAVAAFSTIAPFAVAQETETEPLPTVAPPQSASPGESVPNVSPVLPPSPSILEGAEDPLEDSASERDGTSRPFESALPGINQPRYERPLVVPPQGAGSITPDFNSYHLGPGDTFVVSVQPHPDLSFQATLDLNGSAIVPIEGAVSFDGLTLAEARALLYRTFDQYVQLSNADGSFNPRDLSITLVAQRGVEVTIVGSVQRPGFYPLTDPSVAAALLTAGGATRTSDLRAIQVQRQFRTAQGGTVEETLNVDLFTPLKEGSALPNIRLEDGDVLVVPELDPSDLGEYDRYLVAQSTLAQPIINIRFLNYSGGRSSIGTLNVNNGSNFLDALSLLGVSPDNANLGDVALVRYDPETGRAVTVSLDAKSAIQGDITQNPPLEDTDVIIVGRNLVGRLSFALQTIKRPFRDVLGFTNFFDNFIEDFR